MEPITSVNEGSLNNGLRKNQYPLRVGAEDRLKPSTRFAEQETNCAMSDRFATSEGPGTVWAEVRPMSDLVGDLDWSQTPLRAQAEWDESLRTTVRIMLTSRFPMWMAWGPQLTFLYNDAYARTTLGKKHPWALGKPATEVWSEIWKDIGPRIHRVMETGEASWDETLFLILERSGYSEETYHTFSYSPLAGADGTIQGMLCVVMEDTGRVLGERQLASLGAFAATLVTANTRTEVMEAVSRGLNEQKDMPFALTYVFEDDSMKLRLVARSGIELDHPAARAEIVAGGPDCPWPVEQLLTTGAAVTIDHLADLFPERPTGLWDRKPTQARIVPILRRGQDSPAGIFIAALNPYRQLDASYAGFLDLVASQIAAAIANAEAYEQERKRAEALAELDRAKTAFFSNVSHELRTPLTLILGPVEDAITSQSPLSGGLLEMLHRNALRLLKMVNGLLDFVRIEAGRLQASFQPTDISSLTAQLASVFRSAVERAGLKLVIECPPMPEPVYIDREMWEKIVLNLVSNSLKSTFEGEIRVAISAEGSLARLSVSDTGTGIPETDLPHLFERFHRVDGARRRSHEGSGIGLALVKELVEMHGGSIHVESRIGIGTTFSVAVPFGSKHLPHAQVSDTATPVELHGSAVAYVREALGWIPGQDRIAEEIARAAAGDQPEEEGADAFGRPTILLVDDNSDMREYVRGLLSGRYHVLVAENGSNALEIIRQSRPDLVLSDVMMPEMDGFALLAALRADPATSQIPVVMLSARAGEEARIEGVEAGADDYLIKPFTARELLARVEAQLKLMRLRLKALEQEAALTREIQRTREFAWETLEHLPDAFCTFDHDFRVTYLNPAAMQLSAMSNGPKVGDVLWDTYPMLIGTPVEENLRRCMEERTALTFEQYFPGDGQESWFHFQAYPQPHDGLVLYVRNATAAHLTEHALRRAEQLAAAGRLAASIAHEINNPLEAVTNLLFLAKLDDTISGETRNLLDVADRELQRLSHITARSLRFYRQRTAASLTSMEELMDSVLFFHETEMRMRGIELVRRYRPAPQVLCFSGEIQQVLTNLINNAIQATEERGRVIVRVRPAAAIGETEQVLITVADDGSGMSRQTLDRLFHPFVTTKGESGTGLGLWVSKGILDKHGASIRVRSRQGMGTAFLIFLPVAPVLNTSLASHSA
ncbi:response regulator [Acidobacteria bacterium AB60]|nr:response regulator [Acidobacteria bacterium AB60]